VVSRSLHTVVILNVTEGGVKDLLYLPLHIGAKGRSTHCYWAIAASGRNVWMATLSSSASRAFSASSSGCFDSVR
jgi:hypothetical protein